jgi:prolyl oligopeptidase
MKIKFDRREWLPGLGAALVAVCAPGFAETTKPVVAPQKPSVANMKIVTDTYFGETLSDPYRWMENDKDPEWLPYLKRQNDYARSVLDALPGRDDLLKRIEQLSGDIVTTVHVQRADGRLFFQQRPLGADNFKLFVREGGQDRVLVDPTRMSGKDVGHFSLDWWTASPTDRTSFMA